MKPGNRRSLSSTARAMLVVVVVLLLVASGGAAIAAQRAHFASVSLGSHMDWALAEHTVSVQRDSYVSLLPMIVVSSHAEDADFAADGSVWMATRSGVVHGSADGSSSQIYASRLGFSDRVKAVEVADDGTVWVGGFNGLASFDGTEWTSYRTEGWRPFITDLTVDERGVVWFVGGAGLGSFDGHVWRTYTAPVPADGDSPYLPGSLGAADIEIGDGYLWICVRGLVTRFDPESLTSDEVGPWSDAHAFSVGPSGAVWVLGDVTVRRLTDDGWRLYNYPEAARTDGSLIEVDDEGTPWLVSMTNTDPAGEALFRMKGDESWEPVTSLDGSPGGSLLDHQLSLGPDGEALLLTRDGSQQVIDGDWASGGPVRDGLSASRLGVASTPRGNLVFADSNVLSLFRDGRIETLAVGSGLRNELSVGPGLVVWAKSESRTLLRFEGNEVTEFRSPINADIVLAAPDGGAFVADCFCGGHQVAYVGEDGEVTVYSEGLSMANLQTMAVGRDGTLWTAGQRGFASFDGRKWRTFGAGIVSADRHDPIAVADDGSVWAATAKGVVHFDGRTQTSYELDLGSGGHVEHIAAGPDDTVWAVVTGAGDPVVKISGGIVESFGMEEGLGTLKVLAIARGRGGSAWLVTNAGLMLIPGDPYTVRTGDTLNDIARRYDASVVELLEENPYLRTSARRFGDLIMPGDVIEMPSPLPG